MRDPLIRWPGDETIDAAKVTLDTIAVEIRLRRISLTISWYPNEYEVTAKKNKRMSARAYNKNMIDAIIDALNDLRHEHGI